MLYCVTGGSPVLVTASVVGGAAGADQMCFIFIGPYGFPKIITGENPIFKLVLYAKTDGLLNIQ